ncbi:hypothetical protein WJX75_001022 [Coccomyxa subellipsoidea]|uniref:G domain-containing protein n=1 Tax=Coccomyxa subellipsoidea TaxID=248742 RepID=A0ABR2YWQ9_9CHLO
MRSRGKLEVDGSSISPEFEQDLQDDHPRRGSCYGCGAALQTEEASAPGYVPEEKYEEKRRHRQLGTLVCRRCQELSNGAMVPGVADVWGRDSEERLKMLVSPEQLRTQLARVREQRAVAVLLVDLLDASGSFLSRMRDLVGKNPVFLVGTKVDLLPKGTDLEDVSQWLERSAAQKRLSPIATFLVSSRTREGIAEVAKAVRVERRGRDVYIMGAANVGKSAFVRAFVKEMSDVTSTQFDPAALGVAGHLPVESAMPGTTLQLIALDTFESGGILYDTPGVHLQHRLQHLLDPALTKQLLPKGKLKPFVPPSPRELATQAQLGASSTTRRVAASGTYFWGGLIRIDVLDTPVSTSLAFYGPRPMRGRAANSKGGDSQPQWGRPNCILFCQPHSNDLLTAKLPLENSLSNSVHTFATLPSEVRCFDFGGGGTAVMSGDAGGGLRLWRAANGEPLCSRPCAHSGAVICLAFLGPLQAVSGGQDGRIMTWVLHEGQLVSCQTLHATDAPIVSLALYSPPTSPHQPYSLPLQGISSAEVSNGAVTALSFSLDGSMLCVGSGQQSGNIWVFGTRTWSSRRLRGGFTAPIVACHISADCELLVCTTDGLSSQKLHMPACLECVPSGTAGLSDTYCNHVPVNANGWIETLGPGALISRMAPPVPDFLAPFRLAALSTRGWEAPVPASAWEGSSVAWDAILDPAPLGRLKTDPSPERSRAASPAAQHASSASFHHMKGSFNVLDIGDHRVLPGLTVQQMRQLRERTAACEATASVHLSKAEATRERLEWLRAAELPGSARAYAATAATLSRQAHKYHDLVPLETGEPCMHARRLVRKQLRPGWQATRTFKPCINTVWPVAARKALSIGLDQSPPMFEISRMSVAEAALRAL